MFKKRYMATYYTEIEPITYYEFKAFTRKTAVKKTYNYVEKVNKMGLGNVRYIELVGSKGVVDL